jgi:hypothetical protein
MPLKSKKFVAYLIAEIGWKISLFFILFKAKTGLDYYYFTIILTVIVVSGFIQVGYILGQAALDKYIKVAEAAIERKNGEEKPPL